MPPETVVTDLGPDPLTDPSMAQVPGMQAANRRLARLGVTYVDMTTCSHGYGASTKVTKGRITQDVFSHGLPSPLAALDDLVARIEHARAKDRKGRR